MGRVAYFTVGGYQVLKPRRGTCVLLFYIPCALYKINQSINQSISK